jgi:hypothetical protein
VHLALRASSRPYVIRNGEQTVSDQYKVDLSELEGTITKLNNVLRSMGETQSHAANQTFLPNGALGRRDFGEAVGLEDAHKSMKDHIENIIQYLNDVIADYSSKTKRVHGHYTDAEYDAQSGMSGGAR